MEKPRILVLYTELASYVLVCLKALVEEGAEVQLVHYQVNPEAPFELPDIPGIRRYAKDEFSPKELENLCIAFHPDLVLCCGWTDKQYLKISKCFFGRIPTVMSLDNHWKGRLRQRALAMSSKWILHSRFSHLWVPGGPQMNYASRLGYKPKNILTGFYSCDLEKFMGYNTAFAAAKEGSFPHVFLFVGRYLKFKGIFEMWQAFGEFKRELNSDWELWCIGTGEEYDNRVESEGIKHFGFVQQEDIGEYVAQAGVFILPSTFEPWGVVVHEFAASGFPLLCSTSVGSGSTFLEEQKNGYFFSGGNVPSIKEAFVRISKHSDNELLVMGQHSVGLAQGLSPQMWAKTLLKLIA